MKKLSLALLAALFLAPQFVKADSTVPATSDNSAVAPASSDTSSAKKSMKKHDKKKHDKKMKTQAK